MISKKRRALRLNLGPLAIRRRQLRQPQVGGGTARSTAGRADEVIPAVAGKVGQLVDREATQHAANRCDARVVADLEECAIGLVLIFELGLLLLSIRRHAAQFEHGEGLLTETNALVAEEDRAGGGETNHQDRNQQNRAEHDQQCSGDEQVERLSWRHGCHQRESHGQTRWRDNDAA